jgi:hypothetical protein
MKDKHMAQKPVRQDISAVVTGWIAGRNYLYAFEPYPRCIKWAPKSSKLQYLP